MARAIIILAIIALTAFPAQFWVHSTNGDDGYNGASQDSAFATIGAATNAMTQGDTAFICGIFYETLSPVNGTHEACHYTAWADSGYWTVDGESVRECVKFPSMVGSYDEPTSTIKNIRAINGHSYCVYVSNGNKVSIISCSLSTASSGMLEDRSIVFIDSSHISVESNALMLYGGFIDVRNSIVTSTVGCINTSTYAPLIRSSRNQYSAGLRVIETDRISAIFTEDRFNAQNMALHKGYAPQNLLFSKCLLISSQTGFSSLGSSTLTAPEIAFYNCVLDSMKVAFDFQYTRPSIRFVNTIIANADTAMRNIDFASAEALVIYNVMADTVNVQTPIQFSKFDPQFDSLSIARADSAMLIGSNGNEYFTTPLYDDRGYWFRNEEGIPAVGWRSPYETTGWPSLTGKMWHISTPGRRLR